MSFNEFEAKLTAFLCFFVLSQILNPITLLGLSVFNAMTPFNFE